MTIKSGFFCFYCYHISMKFPLEDSIRNLAKDEIVASFFVKYCLFGFLLNWFFLFVITITVTLLNAPEIIGVILAWGQQLCYFFVFFPVTYKILREKVRLLKQRYDYFSSSNDWTHGVTVYSTRNVEYCELLFAKLTQYIYGFIVSAIFCSIAFTLISKY